MGNPIAKLNAIANQLLFIPLILKRENDSHVLRSLKRIKRRILSK